MLNDLLCVGDKLIAETCFGKNVYTITRVTKTLAFSKRDDDGYEYTFKRKISWDMGHPRQKWNTTKYSVEKATHNYD